MKARLLTQGNLYYVLYHENGFYYPGNEKVLSLLLRQFKDLEELLRAETPLGSWTSDYSDISLVEGDTAAFVNGANELVIRNYQPFEVLWKEIQLDLTNFFNETMTVKEYAAAVGKKESQIIHLLQANRIPGARQLGRVWIIPKSSVEKYPMDNRVTAGGKFSKTK